MEFYLLFCCYLIITAKLSNQVATLQDELKELKKNQESVDTLKDKIKYLSQRNKLLQVAQIEEAKKQLPANSSSPGIGNAIGPSNSGENEFPSPTASLTSASSLSVLSDISQLSGERMMKILLSAIQQYEETSNSNSSNNNNNSNTTTSSAIDPLQTLQYTQELVSTLLPSSDSDNDNDSNNKKANTGREFVGILRNLVGILQKNIPATSSSEEKNSNSNNNNEEGNPFDGQQEPTATVAMNPQDISSILLVRVSPYDEMSGLLFIISELLISNPPFLPSILDSTLPVAFPRFALPNEPSPTPI